MLFCPDDLLEVERDFELDLFPRCVALMYHLLPSSGRVKYRPSQRRIKMASCAELTQSSTAGSQSRLRATLVRSTWTWHRRRLQVWPLAAAYPEFALEVSVKGARRIVSQSRTSQTKFSATYLLLRLCCALQTCKLELERLHMMPSLLQLGIESVKLVIPFDLLVRLSSPFRSEGLAKRLKTGSNRFFDPLTDDIHGRQIGRSHVDIDVEINLVLLLNRARVQTNDSLAMGIFVDERVNIVHPTSNGDLLFTQLPSLFMQLVRQLADRFAEGRSFAVHSRYFIRSQVLLYNLTFELQFVLF